MTHLRNEPRQGRGEMRPRRLIYNPDKSGGVWEPEISEEQVVDVITEYLTLLGAKVYRVRERIPRCRCGRRFKPSEAGILDLWVRLPSARFPGLPAHLRSVFLEVKRPGGKHRDSQEETIREGQADGLPMLFVESVDDVRAFFGQLGIVRKGAA